MFKKKSAMYLASQSPRRRELLDQIGVSYKQVNVDVWEQRHNGEAPAEYVTRLAGDKALAGSMRYADLPILGADTIVVLNGHVLEKPSSKENALAMLAQLSGNTHQVMTAVHIKYKDLSDTALSISSVTFRHITEQEAERYWATGEPQDKAGSYGIQGMGSIFVKEIQGSYSGVVGLPLFETHQLLERFGISSL